MSADGVQSDHGASARSTVHMTEDWPASTTSCLRHESALDGGAAVTISLRWRALGDRKSVQAVLSMCPAWEAPVVLHGQ